jgi:hypothetical protein
MKFLFIKEGVRKYLYIPLALLLSACSTQSVKDCGRKYWDGGAARHYGNHTWYGSLYYYVELYDEETFLIAPEDVKEVGSWQWPNEEAWVESISADSKWPYRMHYRGSVVRAMRVVRKSF